MAETVFSQIYDRVWQILDADVELNTFMGHGRRIRFEDLGDLDPESDGWAKPSDCPALAIKGQETGFAIPDNKAQRQSFALQFLFFHTDLNQKKMWEFYARILSPLIQQLYLSLGLSYVENFSQGAVTYQLAADEDKRLMWRGMFTLTINIRRDGRDNGLFKTD